MMNSALRTPHSAIEIRDSFLQFFRDKQHTIVPSSSLMPDSPNLLFTNAGMNQFVPIFLGQQKCSFTPPRAADTQKCIRAGGKHNDLEDVGMDTYHHTFFEMLGNWSFGDYFKTEAIEWAWELITNVWRFPKARLYATVYAPSDNDPAEFDQEAYDCWAALFSKAGLDPKLHIVPGNKKDNFWMMGDTGPCGPCSEIHVDLTPGGDTKGTLVNRGTAECIEIWNLVFIQLNANADGTFSPLPAKHVDTGMGFERVAAIIQGTKNFTDFNHPISNYDTDIFQPIFNKLSHLSGKTYERTLPSIESPITNPQSQIAIDVAFRVIGDHIRTLSFAIADGIQPGNTDRNYVLRRILRRAVRYGRTLGFREPFFYKLVDVVSDTMGEMFPEIRQRQQHIADIIRTEEEAFNRTLDRGIELFNAEVERVVSKRKQTSEELPGSARVSRAVPGVSPGTPQQVVYSKRNLPHFERPWEKYMITFSVIKSRTLSTKARDIILKTIFHGQDTGRFHLYAVCIMPDHVHLLIEPQTKEEDAQEAPIFWNLKEILHSIKSFSAHEINKIEQKHGPLWEKESYDRLIRSEADLHEKFAYICNNPWNNNIVSHSEDYPWLWTENEPRRDAEADTRDACAPQKISESSSSQNAPQISGAFAFKLYDTYGFPLDLTELMARERGLSVDVTEFDRLMEEQRSRARLAQKREVIELSQIEKEHPTLFCGYDQLDTQARVLDIIQIKGRTAVITDHSVCYAEMGGQVGDTGTLNVDGKLWAITDTRKAGQTWLHFLEGEPTFEPGTEIKLHVNPRRRAAIQRHHTVTHLFHWALHEVVSTDATQKGSFVGPDKLTFDFNSAPLTKDQIRTIEQLVNERILENAPVSWIEIPYESVRNRKDVLQFFGEKYGDHVRVVQIGGTPQALNGYSMELCGGTHTQTTGEIGFFRITAESAIAAGIRRIEAIAGLCAYESAIQDYARLQQLAETLNAPISELEKKLASILAQNKALEKQLATLSQKQAADTAKSLLTHIEQFPKANAIIRHVGDLNGEQLQLIAEQLRSQFEGVLLLIGTGQGRVHLLASVSTNLTNTFQAGKIIQTLAPKVGGKGGGKPELARGAGCDVDGIPNAIAEAKAFLS